MFHYRVLLVPHLLTMPPGDTERIIAFTLSPNKYCKAISETDPIPYEKSPPYRRMNLVILNAEGLLMNVHPMKVLQNS
jgi:hypothetical protein